jgi:hypothetical protein
MSERIGTGVIGDGVEDGSRRTRKTGRPDKTAPLCKPLTNDSLAPTWLGTIRRPDAFFDFSESQMRDAKEDRRYDDQAGSAAAIWLLILCLGLLALLEKLA